MSASKLSRSSPRIKSGFLPPQRRKRPHLDGQQLAAHALCSRANRPGLAYPRYRQAAPCAGDIERSRQSVVNSAWRLRLMRTTRWSTRCLRTVRFREILAGCVMRRKIGTAIVSLLLLSGSRFDVFCSDWRLAFGRAKGSCWFAQGGRHWQHQFNAQSESVL